MSLLLRWESQKILLLQNLVLGYTKFFAAPLRATKNFAAPNSCFRSRKFIILLKTAELGEIYATL